MAAGAAERSRQEEKSETGRIVAFGQENGHVYADGRWVGRAEPFAKVFPSSCAVKREIGGVAWMILEDIALDARMDPDGRLIACTNARRIAKNLALNKGHHRPTSRRATRARVRRSEAEP